MALGETFDHGEAVEDKISKDAKRPVDDVEGYERSDPSKQRN